MDIEDELEKARVHRGLDDARSQLQNALAGFGSGSLMVNALRRRVDELQLEVEELDTRGE